MAESISSNPKHNKRNTYALKKVEKDAQDSRPQPVIEIACKNSISSSSSKFILH